MKTRRERDELFLVNGGRRGAENEIARDREEVYRDAEARKIKRRSLPLE